MNVNSCECAKVNNSNRIGAHVKYTIENDFTESEVKLAKESWIKVGFGDMTDVYKCKICSQLWGASAAGHGWMSYRKLMPECEYKSI